LVSCIVKHVPALDCSFRDKLGKYYDTYNKRLYQWMNDTKADANVNEIKFLPFEDWSTTVPCVPDARALFNDVLAGTTDFIFVEIILFFFVFVAFFFFFPL